MSRPPGTEPAVTFLPPGDPLVHAARDWLAALQDCVRRVDYAAARPLFAPDVAAFGTRAAIVQSRDALEREQWAQVWPAIRDFTFRLDDVRCAAGEGLLAVIVPWESLGVRGDGTAFSRPGRATLLLTRRNGAWVALHSHFSLAPA
jgi:ketosteroid isomerase-like protein